MRWLRFGGPHRGQTIVMFAVAASAFLAMMAIGVDLISMYVHRRDVQGVADLAALGGAKMGTPAAQDAEARAIIALNGIVEGTGTDQATLCINPYYVEVTNVCPTFTASGGGGLEVTITYHTPTGFASILGTLITDVFGRAVALCKIENNYAIFGNHSSGTSVDITGSDIVVDGRVHSNANLTSLGATKTYNAGVTYVGSVSTNGNSHYRPGYPAQTTTQPWPIGPFTKSQFPCDWYWNGAAGGVTVDALLGGSHDFDLDAGSGAWWDNTFTPRKLRAGVYCAHNGTISVSAGGGNNDGSLGATFVVDGNNGKIDVTFQKLMPYLYDPPPPDLVKTDPHNILFINFGGSSVKPGIDVKISASGSWQGWIYMEGAAQNPGPGVKVTGGTASTLLGGIFADTVDLAGAGWQFSGTGPGGDCQTGMSE
jgi:hypothetical protein